MKVYFISGLAADSRVFRHIRLPAKYEIIHLDWITPEKNEHLESYAARLAEKINREENFGLIGLSMGGMIATEIAKKYRPAFLILISSAATRKQFPPQFKATYFLRLHKIVPASFLKSASVLKRLFSAEAVEDKAILRQVIDESDPSFIRWALDAILKWKNEDHIGSIVHIHGTRDMVLPIRYTRPTHVIKGGGHLMVMSRAGEINKILDRLL